MIGALIGPLNQVLSVDLLDVGNLGQTWEDKGKRGKTKANSRRS